MEGSEGKGLGTCFKLHTLNLLDETQASKLNSQRHHRPNIEFQGKIVNLHFTATVKMEGPSTKNFFFFSFLALSRPLLTMFLDFSDYQDALIEEDRQLSKSGR